VTKRDIIKRAKRKAKTSACRYSVSALGFNHKGELIRTATNRPRFTRYGGGVHAEMEIMRTTKNVKTIIICRVGASGELRPIDPCKRCRAKAEELGVQIVTIREDNNA